MEIHFNKKFSECTGRFIILLALFTFISGCREKGCTDSNALNYNSLAGEDDGTCQYCKSSHSKIDSVSVFLYDHNPASIYFSQPIARFDITQFQNKSNDERCGSNNCSISIKIQNLTSKSITFNYITRCDMRQTTAFEHFGVANIPSGKTIYPVNSIKLDDFFNCSLISTGSIFASATDSISYF